MSLSNQSPSNSPEFAAQDSVETSVRKTPSSFRMLQLPKLKTDLNRFSRKANSVNDANEWIEPCFEARRVFPEVSTLKFALVPPRAMHAMSSPAATRESRVPYANMMP